MPKQRFGLGRGLDALIPGATAVSDDVPMDSSLSNSALFEVPVAMISPNPLQPRNPPADDCGTTRETQPRRIRVLFIHHPRAARRRGSHPPR